MDEPDSLSPEPMGDDLHLSSNMDDNGITEARLCWLLLALGLLLGRSLGGLLVCWMLTSCLLLRSYNTLLVPCLYLFSSVVRLQPAPTLLNTVLHHWLGAVFFFYQGNSNSLASVDLAAGYVGLEEYNFVIVGALLFIHTYSMPVLAYLLNIRAIVNHSKFWRMELARSAEMVVFLQLLHVFMCLIVITLHRYHLFVWTVFSPKLLYVAVQTFMYFLLISFTNICIHCAHSLKLLC